MGELLGGAVITETIFGWPGMGKYVMDSIAYLDFRPLWALPWWCPWAMW